MPWVNKGPSRETKYKKGREQPWATSMCCPEERENRAHPLLWAIMQEKAVCAVVGG